MVERKAKKSSAKRLSRKRGAVEENERLILVQALQGIQMFGKRAV